MINKKAKGHKAENEFANKLKAMGYQVQVAQRTSVFTGKFYVSRDNDFFNLFDVLALKNSVIWFTQVKTNYSHVSKAKKDIQAFSESLPGNILIMSVALRVSNKGWVVWTWDNINLTWVKEFATLKLVPCDAFTYS